MLQYFTKRVFNFFLYLNQFVEWWKKIKHCVTKFLCSNSKLSYFSSHIAGPIIIDRQKNKLQLMRERERETKALEMGLNFHIIYMQFKNDKILLWNCQNAASLMKMKKLRCRCSSRLFVLNFWIKTYKFERVVKGLSALFTI